MLILLSLAGYVLFYLSMLTLTMERRNTLIYDFRTRCHDPSAEPDDLCASS